MNEEALITYLKALHISALAFWCAGLIAMPALLLRYRDLTDADDFRRTRRSNRFAFVTLVSPAAFVAIGSGIGLLFAAEAWQAWLFLKLAGVGVLVLTHLYSGHVLVHASRHGMEPPASRLIAGGVAVLVAVPAILWLVLAKPDIDESVLPSWMLQPYQANPPPPPQ